MKKIMWRSWDAILMPGTVIDRVNKLGKDQPKHFVFTDCSGRLLGDVELQGVNGDENETPQNAMAPDQANEVEIVDLDINPNNEMEETDETKWPNHASKRKPSTMEQKSATTRLTTNQRKLKISQHQCRNQLRLQRKSQECIGPQESGF
jgi:hypothetical protein